MTAARLACALVALLATSAAHAGASCAGFARLDLRVPDG